MSFEATARAVEAVRAGRMVILVDDEDRENEGDLCMAAEKVTPEAINFMAMFGRGLICLAMTDEQIAALELPMMVEDNESRFGTAFTVSVEARSGVTTGISAADRAHTILTAVAKDAKPGDLVRPGHIFPLRAQPGGVLARTGQTEGAVDLSRLAGLGPAGVICEIIKDDGTMARRPDLEVFAATHDLPILTIAELIEYRMRHESLVRLLVSRDIVHPEWGPMTLRAYGTTVDKRQHLAMIRGNLRGVDAPLVRVHSGYPLARVFGALFSEGRQTLEASLVQLAREPCGVIVCLDPGEREQALDERIRLLGQARPASSGGGQILREFGIGAQILRELGLTELRLLSNNPKRLAGIEGFGLKIREVVALEQGDVPQAKLHVVGRAET